MASPADAIQLTLTSLAYRCRQETDRYWQRLASDARWCFELFRRALGAPQEAESREAWGFIHRQYHRQVIIWVKRHQLFALTGQAPENLADLALEKMWVAFASAPDKFSRFPGDNAEKGLSSLLRFLQSCVHSVVIDSLRMAEVAEGDASDVQAVDADPAAAAEFWRCIDERLHTDAERLVMDAIFVHGLKPRQVRQLYPDEFHDVRQVYRLTENVLARFRRDPSLAECLGEVSA